MSVSIDVIKAKLKILPRQKNRETNKPCAQIYRQKYLSKDTDIMISANEHFDLALDVTRALARTQPSGGDDHQSIDYSDADVIKYSATEKAYVRSFVFSLFLSSFFLVRLSLTCFYSFLFRSLARRYIDGKCPDSVTVFNKDKKAIKVTRSGLSSLFAVSGRAQDRSEDMAKKLNVTKKVFSELVKELLGEKSMPNLALIENIQNDSVGFSDETLKEYGWVDAKESGVGLLAFFAARSPKERKVLEAENREWRRSLNAKTGETELVKRKTASKRQRVEWEDPETGVPYTVPRSTAYGRELVEREDLVTGETYMVSRNTAYGRKLVEWEDLETGETYMVSRNTANGRELVSFNDQLMRRSAKRSIINSEKKGKWCPCGDKCPSCAIQTSKLWITLRKATEHFVRTGDECGYELADEDVVHYWCQIAPKLSKEMFQANGANERAVCKTCFYFAIKRVSEQLGATSIFVPH